MQSRSVTVRGRTVSTIVMCAWVRGCVGATTPGTGTTRYRRSKLLTLMFDRIRPFFQGPTARSRAESKE